MPPSSFEDAVAMRDAGNPAAASALTAIAKNRGSDWAAAAYELSLLEHGRGRHLEGDAWLQRLGFRHRLSDQIFHQARPSSLPVLPEPTGDAPLRVIDGALPAPLFAAARDLFDSNSPFWGEHSYPTPAFFSYNAPMQRKKRKRGGEEPVAAPGGSLLRAVAQSLLPAV